MPITFQSSSTNSPPVYVWTAPDQSPFDVSLRTWTWSYNRNLRGKDVIFGASGQTKPYDWPNPRGYEPNWRRSWEWSYNRNLRAKDTFYAEPGRAPVFDYPNPRGYEPNWRRSWEWSYNRNLRGKDTIFGAPGQTHPYDWPLPNRGNDPDPRRSLAQYAVLSSYPNRVRSSQQLLETIESGTSNKARLSQQFLETIESGTSNRARLSQQFLETIESGANNTLRLSQQFLETIESGTTNKVRLSQQFLEVIYLPKPHGHKTPPPPLPIPPPRNLDLTSWTFTGGAQRELFNQDIIRGAPGQVITIGDWPNPQRVIWYKDWSQSLALRLPPFVPKPFSQINWPNPTRLTYTTQFGYADQLGTTLSSTGGVVVTDEIHYRPLLATMGYLGHLGSH